MSPKYCIPPLVIAVNRAMVDGGGRRGNKAHRALMATGYMVVHSQTFYAFCPSVYHGAEDLFKNLIDIERFSPISQAITGDVDNER